MSFKACTDHSTFKNGHATPRYDPQIVRKRFSPKQFGMDWVKIDPRLLGQGCCRARIYILVWDLSQLKWNSKHLAVKNMSLVVDSANLNGLFSSPFRYTLSEVFSFMKASSIMDAGDYFWESDAPKVKLTDCQATWQQRLRVIMFKLEWICIIIVEALLQKIRVEKSVQSVI